MTPLPHSYNVQLLGQSHGYAQLSAGNLPDLTLAPPADFGGPGDAWSPEHLLLASVQACYLFTLRAVARQSGLSFETLEADAVGTLDREDGVLRFTAIVLRVRLTVPPGTNLDHARHALEKSKRACLISASLATPVRVDATIVERKADEVPTAA